MEPNDSELKRRFFPRVKIPVYYRPISITEPKRQTSNISLGGMQIYSNMPLKEGKPLEIELFLPNGPTVVAIACVVWIKALPPGSEALYNVGLEFTYVPNNVMNELKSALENTPSDE